MAFNFQYLAKGSMSQEYDKTHNSESGAVTAPIPQPWYYGASAGAANASAAQVEASGYFNGANGYLAVGDIIYVDTNDPALHILRVATNSAGTVTTTASV
jgi:hypothetical protein